MEGILKNLSIFLKSKKAKIALISRVLLISTFVDDGTRMLAFEESLGNGFRKYLSENFLTIVTKILDLCISTEVPDVRNSRKFKEIKDIFHVWWH